MKSDLVDLEVILVRETPNAVLVRCTGRDHSGSWIPTSRCQVEPGEKPGIHVLTLSRKTAEERDLL